MTRPPRAALLLSTCATLLLPPMPAAAQEAGGVFQMLGRIILGTGTGRVAIDTPQAVSVLDQQDLDREQPATIGDLFKSVPGVQSAGSSARPLGQAFNIRGVGNTEQAASEERIRVIVDGAPKFFEQYRMGSFFGDLDLYKRVEVLRGPASSTLYGSGAIGGVVSFTTKDADDFLADSETTALQFKGGYDSNGEGTRAGVVFAHRQGSAEFLGALNTSRSGAKRDGAGNVLEGTSHAAVSGLLKGKFTFGNGDDQTLTLSLSRTDSDLEDAPVAQTGGAALAGFGTADIHTVDDTATLTWNHAFAENPLLDLTVQLSHTDTNARKRNFSLGSFCAPGTFQVLCDGDFGYATTTLRIENKADLSVGDWQNFLTFGVQVSEQRRTATSSVGAMGFHPEGTDRRLGVYAQGELVWNDRLTIIPGIRVDFGDRTPSAAAIAAGARAAADTAVSPKLAALYQINDAWGIFGSVARTERMPTLDELYSSEPEIFSSRTGLYSAERLPSLNLNKEKATSVELGLTFQKTGLLGPDDSLQIKATAFHNDLTDMIATTTRPVGPTPGLTPVTYFSNIRAAEIWGAEVEAAYDAERWFASLAWSKVRSKDRSTGLTLADTPAENVALTLGAKLPDQNLILGWRAFYFDGITTSSATTSASHYDTHDLFVTWSPGEGALAGLAVNLTIENVFDASCRNNLALDAAVGRNAKLQITKAFTW